MARLYLLVLCLLSLALPGVYASSQYSHLDRAHVALKAHRYHHAFSILSNKAKSGCPYSQTMLGHMYATGVGATQDFKAAAHWFEKAAEQGYGQAQLDLGKLYLGKLCFYKIELHTEERFLKTEFARAAFWLRKAAAQGIDEAHQLLTRIPGEEAAENRVVQARVQAAQNASAAESGITTGWKGYADMTNTLNQASQERR